MPTSEQRGFTYLGLLFALVLAGVALAAAGTQWRVALQREREAELMFDGLAIRRAIESYHATPIDGFERYPQDLQQLVEDDRGDRPRYHLRRLYLDPFTGAADWVLLRDADGGIVGVHSRSRVPALARHALPVTLAGPADRDPHRPVPVGDWLFVAAGAAP